VPTNSLVNSKRLLDLTECTRYEVETVAISDPVMWKKGEGKGHTLDVASVTEGTSVHQVWHALSRDFIVLPADPRIYPRME